MQGTEYAHLKHTRNPVGPYDFSLGGEHSKDVPQAQNVEISAVTDLIQR